MPWHKGALCTRGSPGARISLFTSAIIKPAAHSVFRARKATISAQSFLSFPSRNGGGGEARGRIYKRQAGAAAARGVT